MNDHVVLFLTLTFTVIYTSAALAALWIGSRQVRLSLAISNKEKALDAYLQFSEKYAELTRFSHEIEVRYQTGDKTLQDYDVKYFFNTFWVLQLQEWEFFQARILPERVFTQWMMHTHEYLLSGKTKSFFNTEGQTVTITAREGFEKYGHRVLRFHLDFIDFIAALEAIPYGSDVPTTYAAISELVRSVSHDEAYWKI